MDRMSNRIGLFKVNIRFFNGLRPRGGASLFHDMIVLDVQRDFLTNDRTYMAVHPAFRPVLPGEKYPEYIAIFFRDGTALPEWQEIKPTGETIHELIQRPAGVVDLRRERERVIRDWHPPTEAQSRARLNSISDRELRRLVDIQRAGWRGRLDRLLQRGWARVLDLFGRHRNAAPRNDLPQRGLAVFPAPVWGGDVGHQHDAHGDGVLGQGAGGLPSAAGAGVAQVAGGRSAPPRARVDFDPTEDHWADSDAGPYCCGQGKDGSNPSFG